LLLWVKRLVNLVQLLLLDLVHLISYSSAEVAEVVLAPAEAEVAEVELSSKLGSLLSVVPHCLSVLAAEVAVEHLRLTIAEVMGVLGLTRLLLMDLHR
jgi:hypothetical protein